MKILITGNMGYVGPVVIAHLRREMPSATLIGFDTAYFAHNITNRGPIPERKVDVQHFGDIREVPDYVLEGVDSVVHLAAISNDPMGAKFAAVTDEINRKASLALAKKAVDHGVRSFVFASSCSIYGAGGEMPRVEGDTLDPLTAYARSKVATERGLEALDAKGMIITALRFATACGVSDRLRLDLVLNDFVAAAITTGEIVVLSDGSPWRPLIDVSDMARAFEWAVQREESNGGRFLTTNVGRNDWNFQIRDLANAVADEISEVSVKINMRAAPDRRSYQVNFDRFSALAPTHLPRMTLQGTIRALRTRLTRIGFRDGNFRDSEFMRLNMLEKHQTDESLDTLLHWM